MSPSLAPVQVCVLALTPQTAGTCQWLEEKYPQARVHVVRYPGPGAGTPGTLLRTLRGRRCDVLVVGLGRGDFDAGRDTPLWSLVALLTPARLRLFLDPSGRQRPIGWLRFLAVELPGLLVGTMASLLGLLASLPVLCALLRPRRRRTVALSPPLTLAFLRTDLVFGLQAGGSVSHIGGFTRALVRLGQRVVFFSTDHLPGIPPTSAIHVIRPRRLLAVLPEIRNVLFSFRFARQALPILRSRRPDLLYQRYSAFDLSGPLLARRLELPYVLEFNSSEVWKGRYWGGIRLLGLARLTERICLRQADVIVVVSKPLRRDLVAVGVPAARILVSPNGVEPERFCPDLDGTPVRTRYGVAPDEIVVGFTGTFGKWHGIPALAACLAPTLDGDPRVRFLLVGDGELRPLIEEAVAQGDLGARVIRTGLLPHGQVPEHLAACDILISPHTPQADGREFFGSPTKLYEYMAMGKAIVASDLGQIGDVLEHEVSALLVPPGDVEALVAAILRLVAEPALRERLGRAARQAVLASYTWKANARRFLMAVQNVAM
jgi:glycosyltransferase involved in cell wall biosynthesis